MSNTTSTLPPAPNTEHLKHQARDLRKAHQAGDKTAAKRLQANLPRAKKLTQQAVLTAPLTLSEAQLVVAREYGFPSWPKLVAYLQRISQPLHQRPLSLEAKYYEGRAGGLATASHDDMPEVVERARKICPEAVSATGGITPEIAKLVVAREHGFDSWTRLMRHIRDLEKGEAAEPFIAAFQAIKDGDVSALERVLRIDPTLVNAPGSNGNNLLGLAASYSRTDVPAYSEGKSKRQLPIVERLLELGADPNSGNRYGWTPLHQAGYQNSVELAKLVIEYGGDRTLSARGDGGTPLVVALFWGHVEAADYFAGLGGAPHNLRAAAGAGDLEMARGFFTPRGKLKAAAGKHRAFYRPHGGFPEWKPSDDTQEILDEAFTYAARCGRLAAMEFLLENGANINGDPYRGTALTWAAYKGQLKALKWLVERGAAISLKATFGGPQHGQGITALHIAAQCGQREAVEFLVTQGSDLTIQDDLYNGSAWGWAEHGGHAEIAKYLRKAAGLEAE